MGEGRERLECGTQTRPTDRPKEQTRRGPRFHKKVNVKSAGPRRRPGKCLHKYVSSSQYFRAPPGIELFFKKSSPGEMRNLCAFTPLFSSPPSLQTSKNSGSDERQKSGGGGRRMAQQRERQNWVSRSRLREGGEMVGWFGGWELEPESRGGGAE